MTDQKEKLSFRAWFIIRAGNEVQMIDIDPSQVCGDGEVYFGPYTIEIPTPRQICIALEDREQTIVGRVA